MHESETTRPDPFIKAPKTDVKEIVVSRPWQYSQPENCRLEDLQLEELRVGFDKARDLSPMERWEQELIRDQPWHIVGIVAGGYFCEKPPAEEVSGADEGSNRATYYASSQCTESGKRKG